MVSTVEQLPDHPARRICPHVRRRNPPPISSATAVLELSYTAHDHRPVRPRHGPCRCERATCGRPSLWDEDRRLHLRAKLDALYFILYGVYDLTDPAAGRDDIRYIYSTFPIVERQETAAYGHYRSRDLALAYINTLVAGQPDAVVAG